MHNDSSVSSQRMRLINNEIPTASLVMGSIKAQVSAHSHPI